MNTRAVEITLHIGATHTEVRAVSTSVLSVAPTHLVLAIGSQHIAQHFFRHQPPTALEVENAIQTVEDEVVRARALVPADTEIFCADAGARAIATVAGVAPTGAQTLSLEQVEHTFNRWVHLVEGRPQSQDALPADPAFAATLLILREFMHHLQIPAVHLT
jgi:exopolyphosphatase/pppGpp-phosphohydrolase